MNESPEISVRTRVALWVAAWIVAAVVTVVPVFQLLLWGWLFPAGLLAPLSSSMSGPPALGITILVAGWLMYAGLSVYGLTRSKRARFFLVYAILIILLVLNAAGCRYEFDHLQIGGC